MNENDRTTLEQAIYEEMELTPEMIRSIRTLCGVCLCSFVESTAASWSTPANCISAVWSASVWN